MSNKPNIPKEIIAELNIKSKQLYAEIASEATQPSEKVIKIVYSDKGAESPFEEEAPMAKPGLKAYSGDYWGAFSLEKFCGASSLSYTHDDAKGWLEYPVKFHPANFWFKDENVRVWAYYEPYDNWQDTYGLDAVLAVYHSGHGGMTADGKFHAPLGADWGGKGCTAWSDQMCLGDDQVRYLFWSTCYSLRISNGHSPMRTWGNPNCGLRMIFGYETTSVDDPDYGSNFWDRWQKGDSLSTAFLNASWDISHNQVPVVAAFGATSAEAKDRLFNERYLSWDTVGKEWCWWRWYYAANSIMAARTLNQKLPDKLLTAQLQPQVVTGNYISNTLLRHNVDIRLQKTISVGADGIFLVKEGDVKAVFEADGTYEIQLARANLANQEPISAHKALTIAQNFIRQHGLDQGQLIFDRMMLSQTAGASSKSGQIEGPYVTETVVQFTQVINGIPVILPGKGRVAITIDNDGTVTNIKNSVRNIDNLVERFKNNPLAPDEEQRIEMFRSPEQLLAEVWQERMKDWIVKGRMPVGYTTIPGTYEIGYVIKGNEAIVVAKNDIEVDCGNGYFKRYSIEVPILE